MNHKEQRKWAESPHKHANRLSKMSFWWVRNLYKIGLSRTITEDDIYQPKEEHESERIGEKFRDLWSEELQRKDPSVIRMFYRAYGFKMLLIGFLFSICETLNRCAQPLFLGALLKYFADPEGSRNDAYLYGSGIVLCSLVPVITFHPFIYYAMQVAMKTRIGSSRLVYDKVSYSAENLNREDKHVNEFSFIRFYGCQNLHKLMVSMGV